MQRRPRRARRAIFFAHSKYQAKGRGRAAGLGGADRDRTERNFQGYTDDSADALIGLGAIGRMPQGFVQNAVHALRVVIDPELGHNIVDLGFVYDISVLDGAVRITMTATPPGCPAVRFLEVGVANAAAPVPGVGAVDIVMTFDPPGHLPASRRPSGPRSALPHRPVNL